MCLIVSKNIRLVKFQVYAVAEGKYIESKLRDRALATMERA